MFMDVIVHLAERGKKMDDKEMWNELRMRPFEEGCIMDDNLGWAPGLREYGDSDWVMSERFDYSQIREWAA